MIVQLNLFFAGLLLLIPIVVIVVCKLNLIKDTVVAFSRMIIQFAIIAVILQFLFNSESFWITSLWLLVMITAAVLTVYDKLKLPAKIVIPVLGTAFVTTVLFLLPYMAFLVLKAEPFYKPQYIIPMFGMILGNSMSGTALALERYYSDLTTNHAVYLNKIVLGAKVSEATESFFKPAFRAALIPRILNIASLGLISLPGMMTGQIISGTNPVDAIKYQSMIMIFIFTGVTVSVLISLKLFEKLIFDCNMMLKVNGKKKK